MLLANIIKEVQSHSCSKGLYQLRLCPGGSSESPAHNKAQGFLSTYQLNSPMPPAAHGDFGMLAVWDCALFQHLSRPGYPIFKGKPRSGCGCHICHILGICDMLMSFLILAATLR